MNLSNPEPQICAFQYILAGVAIRPRPIITLSPRILPEIRFRPFSRSGVRFVHAIVQLIEDREDDLRRHFLRISGERASKDRPDTLIVSDVEGRIAEVDLARLGQLEITYYRRS